MEIDNKRILEIFLGTILIILLIIMITLFTPQKNQTTSSTIITNSFNTNNYYNPLQKYSTKNYPSYIKTQRDYLDYDYYAYKRTVKGILGNDIEHYIIYVKNQDYKPGYFRVNYYFTDYYGNTKTEAITYYLKPKQGKEFIYKNIYKDKYKFHDWDYKIISKTSL